MKTIFESLFRFILLQLILALLKLFKSKRRRKKLPPWSKEKIEGIEQTLKKREIDLSLDTLNSVLRWVIDIFRGGI